jgi:ankyrin repeat protein
LLTEDPSLANREIHAKEPPLFCLPDDDAMAAELVELLLSFGADPSVRNDKGLTPADVALRNGLEEAAALLEP